MIVYHGTTRNALESIIENNFTPTIDDSCKLFLGNGIYFYPVKYNAIDFCINKKSKSTIYENFIEKVAIVEVEIDDDIKMLSLDDRENVDYFLETYKELYEDLLNSKYKDVFKENVDKKHHLSALINILNDNGCLVNFDGITKTITESIEHYKEIGINRIPRLVFCLFDNSKIKDNIQEVEITKEEFDLCQKLHVKLEV